MLARVLCSIQPNHYLINKNGLTQHTLEGMFACVCGGPSAVKDQPVDASSLGVPAPPSSKGAVDAAGTPTDRQQQQLGSTCQFIKPLTAAAAQGTPHQVSLDSLDAVMMRMPPVVPSARPQTTSRRVDSNSSSSSCWDSESSSSSSSLGDSDLELLAGSSSPASGFSCFSCRGHEHDAAGLLQPGGAAAHITPGCSCREADAGNQQQQQQPWPAELLGTHARRALQAHSGCMPAQQRQQRLLQTQATLPAAHLGRTTTQHPPLRPQLHAPAGGQDAVEVQSLPRSWSWPWGFSSSSGSGVGLEQREAHVAPASLRTASMHGGHGLAREGGLAAVAGVAALHPAVRAFLGGTLGIAFSGGGFRYTYFIGVMDVFVHELGLVGASSLLSGASSGALIAVFTKCGLPVETVLQLTHEFSGDCRAHGVRGRLGRVLAEYLEAYLPEDVHMRCHGSTHLAVTRVWPTIRTRLFSSFATRAELITAVLASCHLPTLSDGRLTVPFAGGAPHIDGGLLSVITPPPGATHSALVCSMPSAQIERLPPFISRPAQPDIAISPDSFQAWPHSRSRTTELALEPPGPEFVAHMVERGRHDARRWAEHVGFTHNGVPVWPTANRLEQLRSHVFGQLVAAVPASAASSGRRAQWELFVSRAAQEGARRQAVGPLPAAMAGCPAAAADAAALLDAVDVVGVSSGRVLQAAHGMS